MNPGSDDDEPEAALLDRLIGTSLTAIPTTLLGRFARLAGTMARAGVAIGTTRLRGTGALDEEALERFVRSLGTLKGGAMKAGQIMSYAVESLPPEARRILATTRAGVLTSSWEEGIRLDAWLKARPSQEERNRIGEALYEFYVGSLLRHGILQRGSPPGELPLQKRRQARDPRLRLRAAAAQSERPAPKRAALLAGLGCGPSASRARRSNRRRSSGQGDVLGRGRGPAAGRRSRGHRWRRPSARGRSAMPRCREGPAARGDA
jgi:hypothetical protein